MIYISDSFLGFKSHSEEMKDASERRRKALRDEIDSKAEKHTKEAADREETTKKLNDDYDTMNNQFKSGKLTKKEFENFRNEHMGLRKKALGSAELPTGSHGGGITDALSNHPYLTAAGAIAAGLGAKKYMDLKKQGKKISF